MLKKILSTLLMVSLGVVYLHGEIKISEREIISAIKSGVPATKELLKKVPIDYISPSDDTLLHYAVRFRKRKVVEYLVGEKILISRKGGIFYGTALQEAIYYGYLGIATYLIDMGTLLNIQNKYGQTALHIAAEKGYLDIVEQLLDAGASKSIADKNGKTPYDLIPDLSWDSRKKLKELLRVKSVKQEVKSKSFKDFIYMNRIHNGIDSKKNNTITVIDKKTKMEDSEIGLKVDIQRTNRF